MEPQKRKDAEKYVKEEILPLVGLPVKTSYNKKEACVIFHCHYKTLMKMAVKGLIRITPHGRIYFCEIVRFFAAPA